MSFLNNCQWTAFGELQCSNNTNHHAPQGVIKSTFDTLHLQQQTQQQPHTNIMWANSSPYHKYMTKTHKKSKDKLNMYYFQLPIQKYYDLVTEIGQPNIINPHPGGISIWFNPGQTNPKYKIFQRIDIIDEQCFNSYPYPHIGFLYTYMKIKIPINKLNKVLSISSDIMYDINKHILIVRGMSINYNIALNALICLYVNGQVSWYSISGNDLVRKMTYHKRLRKIKHQNKNINILNKYIIYKN